jgi:hypothetical protein
MGLIDDQFREANNHIRHVSQLIVTWYVFFVSGNLVAIGWIATADSSKIISGSFLLRLSIYMVFVFVNILGIMALVAVIKYFVIENSRINEMILHTDEDTQIAACFRDSPVPRELYNRSIYLMIASLVAIIIVWVCLSVMQ